MKSVAIVFTHGPHGDASGREGLDALLAISALSDKVAAFFIGDGVLQLQAGQMAEQALSRNHAATFKVLPLYDIDERWVCKQSLLERGLSSQPEWVLDAGILEPDTLRGKLAHYDVILTF